MTSKRGEVNGTFDGEDGEDVNQIIQIEAPSSLSSHNSELNSTGSQSFLTDSQTNFRFTGRSNSHDGTRVGSPSNMVRRWSQSLAKFDKGKKTIREKTIYRLPSRKIFAIDGNLLAPNETEVEQLAKEIEQHEQIMQDNATGEQLRIDTIRALPHSLTVKRNIKERLSQSVTQNSCELTSLIKQFRYKTTMSGFRIWHTVKNNVNNIELWYGSMKEIEGHFGSSVGTYFKFLRWLFTLNLFLFVVIFCFLTLPQILYDTLAEENSVAGNGNVVSLWDQRKPFKAIDLITAEGYLTSSILFYGAYTNMTIALNPPQKYSLPHSYFMTMLCLYICMFIVISSSMARSYRTSFIETSGGLRNMYAHKIFCSWDFGISNAKAAALKQASIFNELREVLSEINSNHRTLNRLQKFWIAASQVTAHFLVFGLLAGLGAGMWFLLQNFAEENDASPWATLYLSLAVNITIIILQTLFSWISGMEDYASPRRTLHVTLLRNFLLEAVIIGVLIVFWLKKKYAGCWETSIGQEIYRLVIVDFVLSVLLTSIIQLFRVNVLMRIFPSIEKPEFDISRKSLGLIYNQTLLWVGLLFSPMLAAVITIKMILTFYIKKYTLIYLCKSPSKLWRSAQTQTLYLVITFLSLLGVVVAHGYIMTQVPVSKKCGPFRGNAYMFQIFVEGVLELRENHWIWRAIMTIARPAVMGGLLLTMCVVVYYLRSKSKARIAMVKLLKDMLYLEAKDKEFLLLNIAKLTQHKEWLFKDDDYNEPRYRTGRDNYAESSSTWRYESRPSPSRQQDGTRLRVPRV